MEEVESKISSAGCTLTSLRAGLEAGSDDELILKDLISLKK